VRRRHPGDELVRELGECARREPEALEAWAREGDVERLIGWARVGRSDGRGRRSEPAPRCTAVFERQKQKRRCFQAAVAACDEPLDIGEVEGHRDCTHARASPCESS
jgi:hypothetical protein